MYCKILLSCALLGVARAGVLTPVVPHAATAAVVAAPVATHRVEEYDPNPQYTYTYHVEDQHTGDSKSQSESRHGDVVEGSYSLVEPDGSRRTVEYTADAHNGFNAVVHREAVHHPVPTPTVAAHPVYARPAVQYAAPAYRPAATPAYRPAAAPAYRPAAAPYSSSRQSY